MDNIEEVREWRECRAETASNGKKIRGYPIVFNVQSQDIPAPGRGFFREVIHPDAVNRTLNEGLDVRALVDHDTKRVIGRTRAGTLLLRKDAKGLRAEIEPDEEISYSRDIMRAVARGDVSGMSFRFKTLDDDWDFGPRVPIRTVLDMTISEVSIVTFPAYLDASVAMRSLQNFQQARGGDRIEWRRKMTRNKLARG